MGYRRTGTLLGASAALAWAVPATAQSGPYDVDLRSGGAELVKGDGAAPAQRWTLSGWVKPDALGAGTVTVVALDGATLALRDGRPALLIGGTAIVAAAPLSKGKWTFVAAHYDGKAATLTIDGADAGSAVVANGTVGGKLRIGGHAPADAGFAGRVAELRFTPNAAPVVAGSAPRDDLIQFETNAPEWPVQVRQMYGQTTPQPAWTIPTSKTPFDKPVARPLPNLPAIAPRAPGLWTVNGWQLAEAPTVEAGGPAISTAGYAAGSWLPATVPGTVLTTFVDRGIYPDPAIGLNNLAIPYKLAHQDYWYRTEFDLPAEAAGKRLELVLNGANYAAGIWVNGVSLGTMKGAFIRGRFDVSAALKPGRNAIAVKVSPPPHPGLAHEESLTSGVGENGGMMMLDGPTFGAAEGWDWIPTLRDRNTGLWQGVDLVATGDAKLGDPQVVTHLPNADNRVAEIEISVPVRNLSAAPLTAEVSAAFNDVAVRKTVTVAPGAETLVVFRPADFPALAVKNPKLWWPNGYGDPALHDLKLAATVGGAPSDSKTTRFGMREVTYDLSLMDPRGDLRRVGVDLTEARARGERIVDNSHQGIRQIANGWAYSLVPGAEKSPAVTPISDEAGLTPYLVLRVNGVRIAARGGNIGMDDFMKRVDRARLEPYFRLHRDAHLNIVRNWVGQNTEESFFELADEYGLMVLSDFWESTQNYNIEAEDVPLFLANARDVVRRYRNHPSIVLWFGRNEGVPQPILNAGLDALIRSEDGTRLFMGSSNSVNLQNSGPYNWRPPVEYFVEHNKGFSVEVGTPSFPTLESWKRAIPASELWPISDSWAYHDWHQTGNGAVSSYMDAMNAQFGAATSLEDFERKAQMLQYDSYRAIFEGMNAGLWKTNSARMLWMTQPAWPSSAWQIFSSDYDTHAAYYGVQKASEPVHVQMNLPDYKVILVNNRAAPIGKVTVRARVTSLDNRILAEKSTRLVPGAGSVSDAFTLDLAPLMANGPVLVRLEALDGAGKRVSDNFYWQAREPGQYRALGGLPSVTLAANATSRNEGGETVATVELSNPGTAAAIETKLTLFNADGSQVLPAWFDANYVSLLPGEKRQVTVRYPASAAKGPVSVALRGWNVAPASVEIAQ